MMHERTVRRCLAPVTSKSSDSPDQVIAKYAADTIIGTKRA